MKNFKTLTTGMIGASLLSIGLYSCNNDNIVEQDNSNNPQYAAKGEDLFNSMFKTREEIALKDFSLAFEKVLSQSKGLRYILKQEALKMTNNDTEVLISMIKDREIENGTFEANINRELNGRKLDEILHIQPTLTVLVPELPEESFNAEKWDFENEIPVVGIRLLTTNDIPVVGNNSNTDVLSFEDIPAFPIVVVKKNERVISSLNLDYSDIQGESFFNSTNGISFKFKDSAYDGIKHPTIKLPGLPDQNRLTQAYEIYKNIDGWQRDHVYYNINPSNPNGPIIYDYSEFIGKMTTNDPVGLYSKIADQSGDATYNNELCGSCAVKFNPWSDGRYEFKFLVRMNSTSGAGETINKWKSIDPRDLFDLTYRHKQKSFLGWKRNFYYFESINAKSITLNLELFNWDLKSKSIEILVSVFEEDDIEEITRTGTFSSKFATNFSGDTKEGMKYGSSSEVSNQATVSYKVTKKSDELGDVIVNFGDKFYISKRQSPFLMSYYNRRYYDTGLVKLTVEPRRVQ